MCVNTVSRVLLISASQLTWIHLSTPVCPSTLHLVWRCDERWPKKCPSPKRGAATYGRFPARALVHGRCLGSAAVISRRATNRCVVRAHRRPCARATNLLSGCASGTRTVITNRLPLARPLHVASRTDWSNGRRSLITSSTSCTHGTRTSRSSPHPPSLYLRAT